MFSALAAMLIACGAMLAVGDVFDVWDLPVGVYVLNGALTLSALLCAAAFTAPAGSGTPPVDDQS